MSKKILYYLQDNWRRLWVLCLWIMIMVGLFTWKFFQYKQKSAYKIMGYCVLTAKGAAETLKFNMALILLPVCRNTITWMRSTKLGHFVPFDDNINFHKVDPTPLHIFFLACFKSSSFGPTLVAFFIFYNASLISWSQSSNCSGTFLCDIHIVGTNF